MIADELPARGRSCGSGPIRRCGPTGRPAARRRWETNGSWPGRTRPRLRGHSSGRTPRRGRARRTRSSWLRPRSGVAPPAYDRRGGRRRPRRRGPVVGRSVVLGAARAVAPHTIMALPVHIDDMSPLATSPDAPNGVHAPAAAPSPRQRAGGRPRAAITSASTTPPREGDRRIRNPRGGVRWRPRRPSWRCRRVPGRDAHRRTN